MQIENNFEEEKKSKSSQLLSEDRSIYSLKSGQEIPDKFNLKLKIISLLSIFVFINILIAHSPFMEKYLNEFQKYLEHYYNTNRPFAIFNVSFFFAFIMIFSIPVQMLYMIVITSVIKDASVLFIILYFTGLLTNFSVYFFMQIPTIRKKWRPVFCSNIYFKVIKMKVEENVWIAAILARLLFIPSGIKLYVMCLLEIPPLCFVLTTLVGEAFDITEYILIGSGVNGLRDFLDKKIWALKTPTEKVHLYIMFGMIFFTLAFLIYIATLFKVTKPSSSSSTQGKSVEFSAQKNSNSQSLTVD